MTRFHRVPARLANHPVAARIIKVKSKSHPQSQSQSSIPVAVHSQPHAEAHTQTPVTQPAHIIKRLQQSRHAFYYGHDVHAYTSSLLERIQEVQFLLSAYCAKLVLNADELAIVMATIRDFYADRPEIGVALDNIASHCRDGKLESPEFPGLDFAPVLNAIWDRLYVFQEPALYLHFGETLEQIGQTCLTGVTNRLLVDFLAFYEPSDE